MTSRILIASIAVAGGACASEPTASWQPPSDTLAIASCSRTPSTDAYTLGQVSFDGGDLVARVATGGGCRTHRFAACWDGSVEDSQPPQVNVQLVHDAGGDTCDALLTYDLRIDVARLRDLRPVVVHVTGAAAQMTGTTGSVRIDL